MADLIIQIGHLSYWRHLRRMTCGPSPNLMGNVWHFDLNVMGPGIENNGLSLFGVGEWVGGVVVLVG